MKKYDVGFAIAGSLMTIAFLVLVNFLTSPAELWSIYPSVALILFPIGFYSVRKKKYALFSMISSCLIGIYLLVENYMHTPEYPWFLYAIAPLVMGPILVTLGKKTRTMTVAVTGSISVILYYFILNMFLSTGFPWAIFPAFAVLWWPLTIYHVKKRAYVRFSVHATLLIGLFFIILNAIASPQEIWAIYPIFGTLWWPLSMYFFVYKRNLES